MNSPLLKYALLTGVAYYFGIKQPLLFVYYDTPFYAYQDKIISFAVIAYIGLFYAASRQREVVPVALWVLGITVLGLTSVNLSDDLASVLRDDQSTLPYWLQTGLLAGYFWLLLGLYARAR